MVVVRDDGDCLMVGMGPRPGQQPGAVHWGLDGHVQCTWSCMRGSFAHFTMRMHLEDRNSLASLVVIASPS